MSAFQELEGQGDQDDVDMFMALSQMPVSERHQLANMMGMPIAFVDRIAGLDKAAITALVNDMDGGMMEGGGAEENLSLAVDDDDNMSMSENTLRPVGETFAEYYPAASGDATDVEKKIHILLSPFADEGNAAIGGVYLGRRFGLHDRFSGMKEEDIVAQLTLDDIIAREGTMVLPKTVVSHALNISERMIDSISSWPGGQTSCGNNVWNRYLLRIMERAVPRQASGTELHSVLADAFAMLVFFDQCEPGYWLVDQEMYMEPQFANFFTQFSVLWKALLAKTDAELGLDGLGGKAGGYREVLLAMIRRSEGQINRCLIDHFHEDEQKPCVAIVTSGAREEQDESSDEDMEDYDEEDIDDYEAM